MAGITHEQVLVNDTATVLTPITNGGLVAHIKNLSATNTVWVGGSGVSVGEGYELLPKEGLDLMHVPAAERVRAICSTGQTADVAIIRFEY